jgi:hypothetical protein
MSLNDWYETREHIPMLDLLQKLNKTVSSSFIARTSSSKPYFVSGASLPQAIKFGNDQVILRQSIERLPPSNLRSGFVFVAVLMASCGAMSLASGYCCLNCASFKVVQDINNYSSPISEGSAYINIGSAQRPLQQYIC